MFRFTVSIEHTTEDDGEFISGGVEKLGVVFFMIAVKDVVDLKLPHREARRVVSLVQFFFTNSIPGPTSPLVDETLPPPPVLFFLRYLTNSFWLSRGYDRALRVGQSLLHLRKRAFALLIRVLLEAPAFGHREFALVQFEQLFELVIFALHFVHLLVQVFDLRVLDVFFCLQTFYVQPQLVLCANVVPDFAFELLHELLKAVVLGLFATALPGHVRLPVLGLLGVDAVDDVLDHLAEDKVDVLHAVYSYYLVAVSLHQRLVGPQVFQVADYLIISNLPR